MGWIKRNLFLVVGGILTLGLLGAAGFYNYKSWVRNSAAFDRLDEIYKTLKEQAPKPGIPGPGNEKVNNTEIAKQQTAQLNEWLAGSVKYFQPIAPIPRGPLTSESFATALHRTISQLQHEADSGNVTLPPQYAFSFEVEGGQKSLMKFAPGSLGPLSVQLGEVKTIAEILFAANINALDGVQRVRMSDDDASGPPSDYIDERPVTNDLAVVTPYAVVFRAFSPEIAQVLAGLASSPHGFIVKGINVQPAGAAGAAPPDMPPGINGPGGPPRLPGDYTPPPAPTAGRGGLQTVLKEQLLRVTVEVEVVKLKPKS